LYLSVIIDIRKEGDGGMMRDVPQVFIFMFLGIAGSLLIFTNFVRGFTVDDDVLVLNTAVRMALTSETDEASRVYVGVAFLSDTFESTLWSELRENYPAGSVVEISYTFDHEDKRFESRTIPHHYVSDLYRIGSSPATDDGPPLNVSYLRHRPLEAIRVRVSLPTDNVSEWTYQTTVKVEFPLTSPILRNVVVARHQLRLIDGALNMYATSGALSDLMRGKVAEALGVSDAVVTEAYLTSKRPDVLQVKHTNELQLDSYDES